MKEQKERTVYIAPVTEHFVVEMEGGFMAGSVMVDGKSSVHSGEQAINEEGAWGNFTAGQFSDSGWN